MRNLDEVINLYLSAAKKNEELAIKYPITSGQCKIFELILTSTDPRYDYEEP